MRTVLYLGVLLLLGERVNPQDQGSEKEGWRQLHYKIKTIDTNCDLPMKMSWYDMGVGKVWGGNFLRVFNEVQKPD